MLGNISSTKNMKNIFYGVKPLLNDGGYRKQRASYLQVIKVYHLRDSSYLANRSHIETHYGFFKFNVLLRD